MSKRIAGVAKGALAGFVALEAIGCGTLEPAPRLPASAFVNNRPVIGPGSGQGVDQPGALVYDAEHRPPPKLAPVAEHISDTVREVVRAPGEEGLRDSGGSDFPPPTSFVPTTQAVTTGQYQVVGAVIAVVNGEPIYADKVLNTLDRALAAEVNAGDERRFRAVAEDLISKQIREFIDNDLEFAAAQRSLEKKDEQIAKYVTGEWRKDQVRKAGGSEALARQKAAEDGLDFDELARQQFRLNMTRLYYQNKIFPLIQVSAQDMRQYYDANLRQFQKPAAVKFRVIFIGTDATGSRAAALDKAKSVYDRARTGEDFASLASKFNDDPSLMRNKGAVGGNQGWIEKGEYAVEKVEQAVWDLKPGEVSAPFDAANHGKDGIWIAKLEEIRPGRSDGFENPKVQDEIRETLKRAQFAKLREAHRRDLVQKAVIRENADMRETIMQMVMQRYHVWTSAGNS